jgi:density-regulated protein DRP1
LVFKSSSYEAPVSIRREVEYCELCGIPSVYCKFFDLHVSEQAKEKEKAKPQQIQQNQKPKIVIKIKSRSKKKKITSVSQLEKWGIDLKEFSKQISRTLSIGCSTKKKEGSTQLIVQGDASGEIIKMLLTQFNVPNAMIQKVDSVVKQTAEQPEKKK